MVSSVVTATAPVSQVTASSRTHRVRRHHHRSVTLLYRPIGSHRTTGDTMDSVETVVSIDRLTELKFNVPLDRKEVVLTTLFSANLLSGTGKTVLMVANLFPVAGFELSILYQVFVDQSVISAR